MAPKAKKQPHESLKQEHVLQAVVIADTFNVRFGPVTLKKPRALLPLVNVPLIDYTLEALAASQVQEVFVFCCHLGEQIREYIKNSKWQDGSSSAMTVVTLLSDSCISVGDALREIDAKSLIRNDFILITGNLVANVDLSQVVEEHKQRTQGKDKSSVMTLLFKNAQPGHRARCKEDEMFLLEEGLTKRLLYFQKSQDQMKFPIPKDILLDHEDVILHNDLMDCHACVCSPIVPTLFTDNFDYQTIHSFVKGILINEEIMGNKIHMSIIQDKYAARVSNLQTYDAISKDVICRWTKPLVPDMFGSSSKKRVKNGRHNVYCGEDVTLSRGSSLGNNVVVGGGTVIGSSTTISHSVIGQNCRIGENVKIENSYLFDNVTIEDNCDVDTSLLCSDVHVLANVVLKKGCVLAWETVVGPQVTLGNGTQLMSEPQKDEFDDLDLSFEGKEKAPDGQANQEKMEEQMDTASYGAKCRAYLYKPFIESDDEEDEIVEDESWWLSATDLRADLSGGSEDSSDEEEDEEDSNEEGGADGEFALDSEEEGEDVVDSALGFNPKACLLKVDADFYKELVATLVRAESEKIKEENLILEINSLKHAFTVPINEVIHSLPCSFIDLAKKLQGNSGASVPSVLAAFKTISSRYSSVLCNYMKDSESQLTAISGIGDFVVKNEEYRTRLPQLFNILYDADVLTEASIIVWYNQSPSPPGSNKALYHSFLKKLAQPFITWLQTAESESSEEEEDEDEDGDGN
ncbi:translation initiation factor eif-2b subunit epsilon [Plakobranchus ocellatus]|uniref:Translation initiation factor eIF2B subunit epsilon n=1 Tax=Plakobranchus ocellatus TaxID=259542 RepID=A0AAV3Y9E6_9GAST|nr:translation initiation factor eif-2b subunit epsilon [Plakobranchus ocellatus]